MKVSIITICLNSEKYIEQTIQSVLGQTYKDIEYIIIDGMSTDSTLDIVEKYKPLFKDRLKVICEKDNGLYDAMNKGIKNSTGEVIGIINSDDWYEIDAVERIIEVYKENKECVIYGAMLDRREDKIDKIQIFDYKELSNQMISHPTVFIPKSIYSNYGVFDERFRIAADYDLMLRLYTRNVKFKFIPKILANFRLGGVSRRMAELCEEETKIVKEKYGYKNEFSINPKKNKKTDYLWAKLIEKIDRINKPNVFIYGSGKHTKTLLEYLKLKINKNIKGIIDRDIELNDNYVFGYKKFNLEEVIDVADIIIISSITYEGEIYDRLQYLDNSINILRIYGADSVEDANEIIQEFTIV